MNRSLASSLRRLVASTEQATGIDIVVDLDLAGDVDVPVVETALRQLVTIGFRHAVELGRCLAIRMDLRSQGSEIRFLLVDDGLPFRRRYSSLGTLRELRAVQSAVEIAGGEFMLSEIERHGVKIEATFRKDGTRPSADPRSGFGSAGRA